MLDVLHDVKTGTLQLHLHFWEQKENRGSKTWWVGGWEAWILLLFAVMGLQHARSKRIVIASQFRSFVLNVLPQTPQNDSVVLDVNNVTLGEQFIMHNRALQLQRLLFGVWPNLWWSLTWSLGHPRLVNFDTEPLLLKSQKPLWNCKCTHNSDLKMFFTQMLMLMNVIWNI